MSSMAVRRPLPPLGEHSNLATESASVGLVFKPNGSQSPGSPPRKKSPKSSRLLGKNRPLSGMSASTSQLSWSGASEGSSAMRRSSSSPGMKSGAMKLPALPKQPLSFEEMYAQATKRAKGKLMEKGKQKPLSPSSTTSQQLSLALRQPPPSIHAILGGIQPNQASMAAMALDVAPSREEQDWATDTLHGRKAVASKDVEEYPKLSRAGSKSSVASRRSSRQHSKELTATIRVPENSGGGNDSTDSKAWRRGKTSESMGSKTSTKSVAKRASDAYIKALRQMMEDGDYTRVDHFCNDVRLAIAGQSGALEERIHMEEEGFSHEELQRMNAAFRRFKSAEAPEVHIDDMPSVLSFLGYMKVDKDVCKDICKDISKYSMFEFSEYVSFVERFALYEREEFQKEFDQFDTDDSMMLSFQEVKELITSMGVTPLRDTLQEAFEVIDFDKSGCLDFDEFVHFMAIYRVTEGFTRKEVHDLKIMFDRVAIKSPGGPKLVPAERLGEVLGRWFGPQSAQLAEKLARRFILGENAMTTQLSSHDGPADEEKNELGDATSNTCLEFAEFLLWARRLREAEIREFHKQFQTYALDERGEVGRKELGEMLYQLGYMPLRHVIDEILLKVDVDNDGGVDFEEFIHLMGIFRKTDGFTDAEAAELTDEFHKNATTPEDDLDDARVDCLHLVELLRGMGYVVNLDKVRLFITEVDFDNTNSLDLSEFLRLMRLHREGELHKAFDVFEENKEKPLGSEQRRSVMSLAGEASLPKIKMMKALSDVGYRPQEADLKDSIADLEEKEGCKLENFDFDQFVAIIDACRRALIHIRRKHAGYADEDLEKYTKAFEVYDEDGNGTIERHELTKLLGDIGIPLRTQKEQAELMGKLDAAREYAFKSGCEEEEVGPLGDPAITFHTMLFLLRLMQTATDEEEAAQETEMVETTGFTPKEIAEFRDIFSQSAHKYAELDPTHNQKQASLERVLSAGGETNEDIARNQTLNIEGMKRIVGALGLRVTNKEVHIMEDKLSDIENEDEDRPQSPGTLPHEKGKYTFFHFLKFMRWIMDTNFCNLNEHLAQEHHTEEEDHV